MKREWGGGRENDVAVGLLCVFISPRLHYHVFYALNVLERGPSSVPATQLVSHSASGRQTKFRHWSLYITANSTTCTVHSSDDMSLLSD